MTLLARKKVFSGAKGLVFGLVASSFFLPASAALAQQAPTDPTGILSGWFETLKGSDMVDASYGSIQAGDAPRSAVVTDGAITVDIPAGKLFKGGAVTLHFTFDAITFEGLRQSDDEIEVSRIDVPGAFKFAADFDLPTKDAAAPKLVEPGASGSMELPDNTQNMEVPQPVKGHFEGSYQNIVIEGLAAPRALPSFVQTQDNPMEFVRAVFDTTRKLAIKRAFVAGAHYTSTSTEIGSASADYKDISLIGMADGRVAEQYMGEIRSTQSTGIPGPSGIPQQIEFKAGPVVVQGLDIAPLAALTGITIEPGRTKVLDREEILNLEMTAGEDRGQVQSLLLENVTIPDTTPLRIFSLAEAQARGENVSEDDLGKAGLEALGAFAIGRMEINGVDFQAEEAQVGLRRFLISNLSGEGLGEVSLSGFSVAVKEQGEAAFDHAGISGITFPPLDALTALDKVKTPTPDQVLAALPTLEKVLVSSFELNVPAEKVNFGLDLFELTQGSHIGKIPTRMSFILDGLVIPANQVQDEGFKQLLTELNVDELTINQSASISWNPGTQELVVSDLSLDVGDAGTASLSLTLGNVPETLFTNPNQAQEALSSANFVSAELRVKNAQLVSAFIKQESAKGQLSPDAMADALVESFKGELGPLASWAFSEELLGALKAFLKDPDELVVSFKPDAPVPVAEILGLAMTYPQALPQRLGAKAVANAE